MIRKPGGVGGERARALSLSRLANENNMDARGIIIFVGLMGYSWLAPATAAETSAVPQQDSLKVAIDTWYRGQSNPTNDEVVTAWKVSRYEIAKNPNNPKDTNTVVRVAMQVEGKVKTDKGVWKTDRRTDVRDFWVLKQGKWELVVSIVP